MRQLSTRLSLPRRLGTRFLAIPTALEMDPGTRIFTTLPVVPVKAIHSS